ncbi:MAG: hypothetical protein WBA50_10740 [Mycobacterium sp.]
MPDDEIGNQLPQPDPRGWLVFDHLPSDLQNREDATLCADHQRWQDSLRGADWLGGAAAIPRPSWMRPATPTERLLLAHLGYDDLPDDLTTWVRYRTNSVRMRRWPALEH